VLWQKKPTVGSFAGCCPRTASGHATDELAIALMKPRRRIAFSKAQDHASGIAITAGIYDGRNGVLGSQCTAAIRDWQSSLWVKTRHGVLKSQCRFTPKADIAERNRHVRFVPKADVLRCSKERRYSITSSARPSISGGTVRPNALAVLRLMISSNLVGAWIGRSAGLAPLRIRLMYSGTWRNCSTKSVP